MAQDPVDETRFPRLAAYLAQLPDGAASHPRCRAKGANVRGLIFADPLEGVPAGSLPSSVRALMAAPPGDSDWVPDAVFFGAALAQADLRALDDAQHAQFLVEAHHQVFRSPAYRAVMKVRSPGTLLTMCGTMWRTMHRGTILSAERGQSSATALLEFPERLYDAQVIEMIRIGFGAAFSFCDVEARVEISERTDTRVRFSAEWR